MSGVEILFAVGGFAFGLIQAYDSALRIVEKIKARRQARQQGLPPTDRLQESLANGKKAVEGAIESGKHQFADFAQGDLLVQNLLLKTTVQIQYVLLERLAAASEDDGVIDFAAVIHASDIAQTQAVAAIYEYLARKQHEEGERVLENASHCWLEGSMVSVTAVRTQSTANNATNMPLRGQRQPLALQTSANNAIQIQAPMRSITSPNLGQQRPVTAPRMAASSRSPDAANSTPPPAIRRRITNGALGQSPALDMQRRSDTSFSSATGSSPSTSTPFSPVTSRRTSYSSHETGSMRSAVNSTAQSGDIHGGTCKYAEFLRNGDITKGLRREDRAPPYASHAKQDIHWCCKSSKCTFSGKGKQDNKKRWNVDDSVKQHGTGVQYRWIFLAKSHIGKRPDQQSSITFYRCLICTILGQLEGEYNLDSLCNHLISHCDKFVGGIRMEGGLRFVNEKVTNDAQFDIFLPRDVVVPTFSRRTTDTTYVESDAFGILDDEPAETPPDHWPDEIDANPWQTT